MSPRWFYGHIFEKKLRADIRKRNKLMQEFKALCSTIPVNEAQAEWIFCAIHGFIVKHPELKPQIKQFFDDDYRKFEELISQNPVFQEALRKISIKS